MRNCWHRLASGKVVWIDSGGMAHKDRPETGVRCGVCRVSHPSVEQVRECYARRYADEMDALAGVVGHWEAQGLAEGPDPDLSYDRKLEQGWVW